MSGAFNIDVEISAVDQNTLKIFCTSLTDNWSVERSTDELVNLHGQLTNEGMELPSCPGIGNLPENETFLSELGIAPKILKSATFQDFLKVPDNVREGLRYATDRPFGEVVKQGILIKAPRYVKRNGKTKTVKVTQDKSGNTKSVCIACFANEQSEKPHCALKFSKQTELAVMKNVSNGITISSGRRQWTLIASSAHDFQDWYSSLAQIMKECGATKIEPVPSVLVQRSTSQSAGVGIFGKEASISLTQTMMRKTADVNELRGELDVLRRECGQLQRQLQDLEEKVDDATGGPLTAQQKEWYKERSNLVEMYESQHEDLKGEIEELKKKLTLKAPITAPSTGVKSLFGDAFEGDTELKSEIDVEKKQLESLTPEERNNIQFRHRHLHRSVYKNVHHHRHIHIRDDLEKMAVRLEDSHTLTHSITHTNTQFMVKKKFW